MARAIDFSTLEENQYVLLGISPDATAKQVRDGWRLQVKRWHTDTAINRENVPLNEQMIRKVNVAYDILKKHRQAYDAFLARHQPQPQSAATDSAGPRAHSRPGKAAYDAWNLARNAAGTARRRDSRGFSADDIEDIFVVLLVIGFFIVLLTHAK